MYEKFLKSIGVDSKTISELAKAAEEKKDDLDITESVASYKAAQKKIWENDPDLVSEISGREKGKLLDIYTRKIKSTFGLESAQIKDKTIEEVIAIAKAESTKGLDKNLQTLQEELMQATAKVKDFEDVQIPKIKAEVEAEKKSFLIGKKLQAKLPVDKLRVPVETAELVLNGQLAAAYDLDMDEKGELLIFNKGTRLQAKSGDGTKLLTADDIISETLNKNKFIKESNADDIDPVTGKKKVEVTPPAPVKTDAVKLPPHLEAARKHQEEIKAQMAASKAASS